MELNLKNKTGEYRFGRLGWEVLYNSSSWVKIGLQFAWCGWSGVGQPSN
jgi:hypothetical protein